MAGGLGGGEANQIGDFECGAEARHGIVHGEALSKPPGMFARGLGIDHAGTTAFTVMPNLPSSFAAARVSPRSPAFDAVSCAPPSVLTIRPAEDEILTIRP